MTDHPDPSQALTFAADYRPEATFRVAARLPQTVVERVLGRERDGEPVIVDTAGYDAYLASYRPDRPLSGYVLVFVDGALRVEREYSFGSVAVFFDGRLGLIEAEIGTDGAPPTPDRDEGTPESEEDNGEGDD